jgi:hypothetical protein
MSIDLLIGRSEWPLPLRETAIRTFGDALEAVGRHTDATTQFKLADRIAGSATRQ